ncbi:hypothetical protein Pan44_32420 [Caulifigura coniformis]|uniref:Uncharacterized protein n=1 Tax=Caulifigura coniformis TaxID=2527983 RepID=A0A517SGH0_9PLAN|nr:hypothetical protein [Caulifigura coniformis]QDT55200.1 hypothetical protein Pan44_32420 [Caulifigura coniformis]
MNYSQLDPNLIVATAEQLCRRVRERFPVAGLNNCSNQLLEITKQAKVRAAAIGAPMRWLRVLLAIAVAVIVVLFVLTARQVRLRDADLEGGQLIQILEAGFNATVLVGALIVFLFTIELRVKRRRALKAIHELRSLSHIIDMHQLTKDPERMLQKGADTESSPKRTMTQFELSRYLDYCTEMLSLCGKVAALYVQNFEDADAVSAVNDLEDLTSGLTRKIWQKIMIIHAARETQPA